MISLFRIDDRLIHAQVVIGWGRVLLPDRIVIADDTIASDVRERELYAHAVPSEIKVSIFSLSDAVEHINEGVFGGENIFLLVKSPGDALALVELGLETGEVNVGCMHYEDGKNKLHGKLFVNEDERKALRELVKREITLEARALPEDKRVILNSLVV